MAIVTYKFKNPTWVNQQFSRSMIRSKVVVAAMEASWRAYYEWRSLASKELHTSKEEYLDSMIPPEMSVTGSHGIKVELGLSGWLPVAVEKGVSRFDMKKSLFTSGKSKRIIPFHKKARKGFSYADVHKDMPSGVSNLWQFKSSSAGEAEGRSLSWLAKSLNEKSKSKGYEIRQNIKSPRKKFRAGADSYRTMSINSPHKSWMHPGIRKRELYDQVNEKLVTEYIPEAFKRHLGIPVKIKTIKR